ncbi:MAG: copper resistance system multicopper oxidase [Janthinobacterium lividum]|nr:copper resistance system multicopper oxidase [Massilia yuzhufengensis]
MKRSEVTDRCASSWRRRFLQGLGAAIGLAGFSPRALFAAQDRHKLRGTSFDLEIGPMPVNFTGADRIATAVNGQVPAPTLYWNEGDTVTIRVTNRLPTVSSIHWHGILLPADMDGVPGLSFAGIEPGQTFTYRFEVKQSGTYWYHSHSAFQEQLGLYGPIVILPKAGERAQADRDYVVMLSDWTDEKPERVMANLKKMSDFFNNKQPTFGEFVRDVRSMGFAAAVEKRKMWNQMRMMPTDFSDVTASRNISGALRYLINGATAEMNWTGLFKPGEKLRLRIINGAATTIFDLRIPGLKMTVVSADGQDVEPIPVDELRISVAETYDVIIEPAEDKAYTIFAQSIGRSGFVRATLAPRPGMQAPVPPVDEAEWLTMTDMMGAMAMSVMHGSHGAAGGHAMRAQGAAGTSSPETATGAAADHSHMQHAMPAAASHAGHTQMPQAAPGPASPPKVTHARSEYGPGVDMHVDMPRTNLDDPGPNLRNNGRRVLTYADLRTVGGPVDPREPSREIELHLTGNMERFMWSFDGQKFSEALPIHFRFGERLRIVLVNDTMMNHPIHLHGMWSELESERGEFQVRKHTINVQPAQRVTFRVTADAPGHWAFHCHLLYHMEAGMFREVVVS